MTAPIKFYLHHFRDDHPLKAHYQNVPIGDYHVCCPNSEILCFLYYHCRNAVLEYCFADIVNIDVVSCTTTVIVSR